MHSAFRQSARNPSRTLLTYVLLTLFLLLALLPFIGIILTAFKSTTELANSPFSLPSQWNLDNFVEAWNGARFSSYFAASVIVVIPVVVISSILSTMSGFGFGVLDRSTAERTVNSMRCTVCSSACQQLSTRSL